MTRLVGFGFAFLALFASAAEKPVERIAFGSCNLQLRPQKHWSTIAKEKADLWIWMGDIVYADLLSTSKREREYNRVKLSPFYQELLNVTRVLGTWDDHDYGNDNSGIEFDDKIDSQRLVLDFLDEPVGSPRRSQEGIYQSYAVGPPGQQVKIILMDMRYFREAPGPKARILGETQWLWLESEFATGNEALTVLVSSSQVLPTDSSNDKWSDYPAEKARLLKLLDNSRRNVLILSGDVHFAEVSRAATAGGGWLYEATSSGLTHVTSSKTVENSLRVGPFLPKLNYGALALRWGNRTVEVRIDLKGTDGATLFSQPVSYQW